MYGNKIKKLIVPVICLLLLGCLAFYIIQGRGKLRAISGIREPIQTPAKKGATSSTRCKGYGVIFYYQYEYDIEGLVVHTHNYTGTDVGDGLSPVDLGLAWGDVAANNTKVDFHWDQMNRYLTWELKTYDELAKVGDVKTINSQCSNNHIIPATTNIKKQVKKIRSGDHVRLKGYLVNVYAENDSGRSFEWNTSTTRDDTGAHACEVFYVTDVEMLE